MHEERSLCKWIVDLEAWRLYQSWAVSPRWTQWFSNALLLLGKYLAFMGVESWDILDVWMCFSEFNYEVSK